VGGKDARGIVRRVRMQIFDSLPNDIKCPICGMYGGGRYILVPVDGTQKEDGTMDGMSIHTKCLLTLPFRFNMEHKLLYFKTE